MSHDGDDLDALSQAASNVVKARARRRWEQEVARRKRRGRLLAVLLIFALGGAVGFFVVKLTQPPEAPPQAQPPAVERKEFASTADVERKAELEAAWGRVKDRVDPLYEPLLNEARVQLQTVQSLWDAGRFSEAAAGFDPLAATLEKVEQLDRSKEAAVETRKEAEAAAADAKSRDAEAMTGVLWAEAVAASDKAQQAFDRGEFDAALEGWRFAGEVYTRAALAADKAKAAKSALKAFETSLTRRFDRATIEAHGGTAWAELAATVKAGDEHYTAQQFDEARQKYEQAAGLVPGVELAVQRQIGVHYYAVAAGYNAADLLLRHAAGDNPGEERWNAYRAALEDLSLPPEVVSEIVSNREAPYARLAATVMDKAAEAVEARWGKPAAASFAIGVHTRLIERLLESDADAFARQDAAEVRRLVTLIQKQSQAAGYPPPLQAALKQLSEKLAIKPEYEAIRQSRAVWSDLVRQLDSFDKAIKLLPRSGDASDPPAPPEPNAPGVDPE